VGRKQEAVGRKRKKGKNPALSEAKGQRAKGKVKMKTVKGVGEGERERQNRRAAEGSGKAAERRQNLAQGVSPGLGRPLDVFVFGLGSQHEAGREEKSKIKKQK